MEDPRFRRSVILLSAHAEGGSLGVVLNNPTGRTLGQFDKGIEESALASALVCGWAGRGRADYSGGLEMDKLDRSFQLYFGIDGQKARIFWETARNSPSWISRACRLVRGATGG